MDTVNGYGSKHHKTLSEVCETGIGDTKEVKAGGSGTQGHPLLQGLHETLSYRLQMLPRRGCMWKKCIASN